MQRVWYRLLAALLGSASVTGSGRGRMPAPGVARHDNLPAHGVHLFGRKRDLAIARTELLATEGWLLTMTGTGGCGKTHLALAWPPVF